MNRSKMLVLGLGLVGAVVAVEEWRIAGLRARVGTLEQEVADALAAIPPPPRPVPPGEDPDSMLRRSKARRVMERSREAAVADFVAAGGGEEPRPDPDANHADENPVGGEPDPEDAASPGATAEGRVMMDRQLRGTVATLYRDLIVKFQLQGVEAQYFVDLLVEGMTNRQQLALDLLDAKSEDERVEVQRRAEQAAIDLAERVRRFLASEEDFRTYQAFQRYVEQLPEGGEDGVGGG